MADEPTALPTHVGTEISHSMLGGTSASLTTSSNRDGAINNVSPRLMTRVIFSKVDVSRSLRRRATGVGNGRQVG